MDDVKKDLFTVAMTGISMWGSAKDFGTSYCFVAGTLVTTEDGQKPIYLSLNTVMNFFSKSKKEKYIMTPLSFVTSMCFWITALQM